MSDSVDQAWVDRSASLGIYAGNLSVCQWEGEMVDLLLITAELALESEQPPFSFYKNMIVCVWNQCHKC